MPALAAHHIALATICMCGTCACACTLSRGSQKRHDLCRLTIFKWRNKIATNFTKQLPCEKEMPWRQQLGRGTCVTATFVVVVAISPQTHTHTHKRQLMLHVALLATKKLEHTRTRQRHFMGGRMPFALSNVTACVQTNPKHSASNNRRKKEKSKENKATLATCIYI